MHDVSLGSCPTQVALFDILWCTLLYVQLKRRDNRIPSGHVGGSPKVQLYRLLAEYFSAQDNTPDVVFSVHLS